MNFFILAYPEKNKFFRSSPLYYTIFFREGPVPISFLFRRNRAFLESGNLYSGYAHCKNIKKPSLKLFPGDCTDKITVSIWNHLLEQDTTFKSILRAKDYRNWTKKILCCMGFVVAFGRVFPSISTKIARFMEGHRCTSCKTDREWI